MVSMEMIIIVNSKTNVCVCVVCVWIIVFEWVKLSQALHSIVSDFEFDEKIKFTIDLRRRERKKQKTLWTNAPVVWKLFAIMSIRIFFCCRMDETMSYCPLDLEWSTYFCYRTTQIAQRFTIFVWSVIWCLVCGDIVYTVEIII